jgi:hypothetical protein
MAIAVAATAEDVTLMSVQVKEAPLRATPSFLAKTAAALPYGSRVAVMETQGAWQRVQTPNGKHTGWLHSSALTPKRIELEAGTEDAGTAASSDELVLAGKGFNSDVEAEFRARNADVDFTWVNRMETFNVPADEKQQFIEVGGLRIREGGAQ